MAHKSTYDVVFPFGKHKGKSLGLVFDSDPNYIQWLANSPSMPGNWPVACARTIQNQTVEDLNLPRQETHNFKKLDVEMSTTAKGLICVSFAYDKDLLERFKFEIDGRKWDNDEKHWTVPAPQLPKMVELFGGTQNISATDEVKKLYKSEVSRRFSLDEIRVKEDTDIEIKNLKLPLRPYQKVAVEFLMRAGGRGMDADQPGLGKTATAIAYAAHHELKTLVIAPKSVIIHWQREIERFTGKKATIWSSETKTGRVDAQYHLINYDIVDRRIDELRKIDFDLLVCDEATMLKNRQTKRAKTILGDYKQRKLFPGIKTKYVIFLTGTPVMNRPVEAFSLLNFLDKDRFSNFYQFVQKYGGWKGTEPRNLDDLHRRVQDLIIRRLKKDILSELPEKQRNNLCVELTPKEVKEYNDLLDKLFRKWRSLGKPTIGEMPAIQQYLLEKKMPRAIEMIDEYLDGEESILVYSCFIDPLKKLAAHYGDKAVLLHGQMTMNERQASIDSLRSGKAKIGLFSVGAGAMGIDGLQHAIDTVLFLDMWWVPSIHEQAEDRLFRIGQTKKVSVYYMMCEGTIDEYMRNILDEKQKIIDQIVDGGIVTGPQNKSFFKEFVYALKKGYLQDMVKMDIESIKDDIPELEV